ncbi:MAG: hypothetical protein U0892_18555 [Pirellulales bacterium]
MSTIKLIDPNAVPAAAKSFNGSGIANNRVTLANHGFTNGQAVTYRAASALKFRNAAVDVVGNAATDPNHRYDSADNNNIYLPAHGLNTGDQIVYTATSGEPVLGLVSGQRYFVIRVNADEIKLAATLREATGDAADQISVTPIPIAANSAQSQVDLSIRRVVDLPIGGLEDGVTYYIANANATSFQLARDSAGTNLVSLSGVDAASQVVLTGNSTLGTEGVSLTAPGSGLQRLTLDLTSLGSGTAEFFGVGSALALTGAPTGDNVATASATGSGGGLVRVSGADTTAKSEPNVSITIGNNGSSGAVFNAATIVVKSDAIANAAASAAGSGGGLVSVGSTKATVLSNSVGTVSINNARFFASDSISVTAGSTINSSILSRSEGGGFVDVGDADSNLLN